MRLARLESSGFRNLDGSIEFPASTTLLVGPNNAGKTNVIDAIRLITPPRSDSPFQRRVTLDDFRHDELGVRDADAFELTATFEDLTPAETIAMTSCLVGGETTAKIRLAATVGMRDRVTWRLFGGEAHQPLADEMAREIVKHTYLPPLRDAKNDLRPGRDNKLVQLLKAFAPDGERRTRIEEIARTANRALDETEAVRMAHEEIRNRLRKMGGRHFTQATALRFAEMQFERIVSALKALAGSTTPLELGENGLGLNNLLYMATLLAAVGAENEDEDGTHILLVEEPEAHLHPQLQELLFRFLVEDSGLRRQVIVSTHSPNFAASAGVEAMTILVQPPGARFPIARSPARFGLEASTRLHLQRFLDVTKAGLLFANGVVLVEGIAEQLLLPSLVKRIGRDLKDDGVSVLNVGGVAFAPFASLFARERLPVRCAIVSDADPPEVVGDLVGGDADLSATAQQLQRIQNDQLHVYLSQRTFEWDLARADNWTTMLEALALVKPRVARALAADRPVAPNEQADLLYSKIGDIKGRFAQALVQVLSDDRPFNVPDYLRDAR